MGSVSTYAYINAKIRAMRAQLLTAEQIDSLVQALTIRDCIPLLKNTPYAQLLPDDTNTLNIHILESAIVNHAIAEIQKIKQHSPKSLQPLISLFLEYYEINKLKHILRLWSRQETDDYLDLLKKPVCYDLPLSRLLESRSLEEFVLQLAHTPFKTPLFNSLALYTTKKTLFYCESNLDKDYYTRLSAAFSALSSQDRSIAKHLLGIEIDIQNINMVVRLREFYKLPLGEILECIIPFGYKINEKMVRNLYTADNVPAFISSIGLAPYKELAVLMQTTETEHTMLMIDTILWQFLLRQSITQFTRYPFTIGIILGYCILKRIEIKNLISIINSKLYESGSTREILSSCLIR